MKTIVTFFLFALSFHFALGQRDTVYDSERITNSRFDTLNLPVVVYHKLLRYHDPILYVSAFPHFNPAKPRSMPLQDGEGKGGYLLEGNLVHRLPLYKGAYYSPGIARRLRLTFDAGFTVRMTKDSSSPLLPSNNRFGLGLDFLINDFSKAEEAFGKLHIWGSLQAHHYSNGQAENGFYETEEPLRNKYKNGDFSTNYLRLAFFAAKEFFGRTVASAGLGYQRDLAFGGPFSLSKELENSYGLNTMLLTLQLLNRPRFGVIEGEEVRLLPKWKQYAYRGELSFILDKNLSRFPSANKYRFGIHNYLTWFPFSKADIGLMAKHYFGRDYLNIRYDDVVNTYQLGFVVDIGR